MEGERARTGAVWIPALICGAAECKTNVSRGPKIVQNAVLRPEKGASHWRVTFFAVATNCDNDYRCERGACLAILRCTFRQSMRCQGQLTSFGERKQGIENPGDWSDQLAMRRVLSRASVATRPRFSAARIRSIAQHSQTTRLWRCAPSKIHCATAALAVLEYQSGSMPTASPCFDPVYSIKNDTNFSTRITSGRASIDVPIDQAQRRDRWASRIRSRVVMVARLPQVRGRYRVVVEFESHEPRSEDYGVKRTSVTISKRKRRISGTHATYHGPGCLELAVSTTHLVWMSALQDLRLQEISQLASVQLQIAWRGMW